GTGNGAGIGAGMGFSYGSGYGIYAGKDIAITSLNGCVAGTGTAINGTLGIGAGGGLGVGAAAGFGNGSGYGIYAGKDITIGILAGTAEGTGFALDLALGFGVGAEDGLGVGAAAGLSRGSGYGLYAGNTISIDNLSGNVYGSGTAVGGALGIGIASVGAGVGDGSGYGLYAGQDVAIDTLSGNVTGTGFAMSSGVGVGIIPAGIGGGDGSGYGIYAGKDITINTLSGSVNANGTDIATGFVGVGSTSGYGLYTGKNITIGTLSGAVKADATAIGVGAAGVGYAAGYGLWAGENIKIDTLSGTVSVSASTAGGVIGAGFASAYGMYAGKDISIRILSGTIKAESANYWLRIPGTGHNAYGIYARGALNGGSPDICAFISGKVLAQASGDAMAVRSDGPMNIYVIGNLSGIDTSWFSWMQDDGYAIYGGKENDIVSLDTGAAITGKIDLGRGSNTLNLYGSNSLNSYFTNITDLNVGDGFRGAYWTLDSGSSGSSFNKTSINPYGIFAVNTDVTGSVRVAGNAILTGKGTITGDVTNDGILMPYNSKDPIGKNNVLTIYGNYTHNANALFMVRANSEGKADRLVVAKPHWYLQGQGIATLAGGTVSVLADTGTYEKDKRYTILTANKVNGTFKNAETNLAFLDPSLTYDSTNAYLTLTRNGKAFSGVAETQNQRNVASIFEKAERDRTKIPYPVGSLKATTATFSSAVSNLESLSAREAKGAYDRLSGYSYTASTAIGFSVFNKYMDVMKNRMHSFISGDPSFSFAGLPVVGSRTDMGSNEGTMLLYALNNLEASEKYQPQWGFFARGYGGFGEAKQSDISSQYNHATSGYVMGFDSKVSPSLLMGGTMGYSYTKLGMSNLEDAGNLRSHQASFYGIYNNGPVYVNGILGYGFNDYDTTRQLNFSTNDRIARASYSGHIMSAYAETGIQFTGEYLDIIPLAGIQGSYFMRSSFTESDASTVGLSIDSQSYSSLVSSLGVRLRKEITLERGIMTPEVRLRWDHEFSNDDLGMNASFIAYPGASFTVTPTRPDRDRLVAGVSLIRQSADNLSLYLSYEGTFSPNEILHTGGMGLKYRW
ncbi:MAG: autotransporter domain-containing protein, partial [Syntrophorhabdus sp.]